MTKIHIFYFILQNNLILATYVHFSIIKLLTYKTHSTIVQHSWLLYCVYSVSFYNKHKSFKTIPSKNVLYKINMKLSEITLE